MQGPAVLVVFHLWRAEGAGAQISTLRERQCMLDCESGAPPARASQATGANRELCIRVRRAAAPSSAGVALPALQGQPALLLRAAAAAPPTLRRMTISRPMVFSQTEQSLQAVPFLARLISVKPQHCTQLAGAGTLPTPRRTPLCCQLCCPAERYLAAPSAALRCAAPVAPASSRSMNEQVVAQPAHSCKAAAPRITQLPARRPRRTAASAASPWPGCAAPGGGTPWCPR